MARILILAVIISAINILTAYEYEYYSSAKMYYKPVSSPASWMVAAETCHKDGGFLAFPKSKEQLDAINDITKNKLNDEYIHIGCHRLSQHDKRAVSYKDGTLQGSFLKWWDNWAIQKNDYFCGLDKNLIWFSKYDDQYPFICENAYEYYPSAKMYYKPVYSRATWMMAAASCHKDGGYLAFPKSKQQLDAINDITKNKLNDAYIHIGCHRLSLLDNRAVSYKDATLVQHFIKWWDDWPIQENDYYCSLGRDLLWFSEFDTKYWFICEKSLTSDAIGGAESNIEDLDNEIPKLEDKLGEIYVIISPTTYT